MTVQIVNPTTELPTFDTPDVGPGGVALTFRLTVADAGVDQTVATGDEVMLDGSGSSDPENDLNPDSVYLWKQNAGPAVTLSASGAINPAFMAP